MGINYASLYKESTKSPLYIKGKLDADWYVVKDEKTIKISFEGSKSLRDFIQDVKFFSKVVKPFEDCSLTVHTGFWEAYEAVRSNVLDKCYELYEEGDTFLILGHSLGGAMAVICAEDIFYHFKLKPTVITWGHPRVTKDNDTHELLKSCMNEDSVFFSNGSDVVPTLPFSSWKDLERTHLGKKFNAFKGWLDILIFKFQYHCGYGKEDLYK